MRSSMRPPVADCSVSGRMILAIMKAAGADMTEVATPGVKTIDDLAGYRVYRADTLRRIDLDWSTDPRR